MGASFSYSTHGYRGMGGHHHPSLHEAEQSALVGVATTSFTLVIGEDLPGLVRRGCNCGHKMGFTMVITSMSWEITTTTMVMYPLRTGTAPPK